MPMGPPGNGGVGPPLIVVILEAAGPPDGILQAMEPIPFPGPFIGPVMVHIGPFIGGQGPLIAMVDALGPHIEFGVELLGNIPGFIFSTPDGLLNLGRKSKLGAGLGPGTPDWFGRAGRYCMVFGALGFTCTLAPLYGPAIVQLGPGPGALGPTIRGFGPVIMDIVPGDVPLGPPTGDVIIFGLVDTGGMANIEPGLSIIAPAGGAWPTVAEAGGEPPLGPEVSC